MNKVFISKNYRDRFTASSKAKIDAETIAYRNGFRNIGLPQKTFQNKYLGRAWTFLSHKLGLLRLRKGSIFFAQYPSYGVLEQVKMAKSKRCKVIILIHDLNILRNLDDDSIEPLKYADILIAHTEAMKRWLIANGFKQEIKVLGIFDYLASSPTYRHIKRDNITTVAFAGNLKKSKFLRNLSSHNILYKLFGVGGEDLTTSKNITYCGCFPPESLGNHLDSDFGLVWDGDTSEYISGNTGEYLKYISPHKASMYLSSGLPIIVWDKSAIASFVLTHNIGIVVSNLHNLEMLTARLRENDYFTMKRNAVKIGGKIQSGFYLSTVLRESRNA